MASHKHEMDKGWAWVVLACSWMSLFLICFLSASAGILQVEIIDDLRVGSGPVSIMTALALGLASLLGPLSGVMASLLSARTTVFLGTILMSFGMLATSFSYSISAMMFFYGFITGLGFGIAYSPIVVVISFYFEKHRILANGIILCSSGVGMLSVPFFERYVIDSYGWRFAFAINGAMMLHILIFAAAFFPTDMEKMNIINCSSFWCWKNRVLNMRNEIKNKQILINVDEEGKVETKYVSDGELKSTGIQSKKYSTVLKPSFMLDSSSLKSKSQTLTINGSPLNIINTTHIPLYVTETNEVKKTMQGTLENGNMSTNLEDSLKNGSHLEDKDYENYNSDFFRQRTFSEVSSCSVISNDTQGSNKVLPRDMKKYKFGQLRKASSGGRSYLGSGLGWASSDLGSSIMLPVKIEEMAAASAEDKTSILEQIKRICKHKAVWILSINSLFFLSGFGIHGVHFPSFAESKGMTRQQVAEFYTAFGLVLMAGRLAGGWVFNKLKPPLCALMFILQFLNGIAMGLAPFYATSPLGIFIMQACFGLLYGQSYMVLPAVIAQIMGVQDLAISFGIIHLFMGFGYILAPIIAGFIFDVTKTYDIPYYLGGTLYLLGALTLILMVFVKEEADAGKEDNNKEEMTEGMKDGEEETIKTTPLIDNN